MTIARFLLLAILFTAPAVFAAETPFDMTPERGATDKAAGTGADAEKPVPEDTTTRSAPNDTVVQPAVVKAPFRRYLAPFPKLWLEGETDRISWSFYLTPEQAASPAGLNLAYWNAIVVAPEASKLTIEINAVPVVDAPIAAPDKAEPQTVTIPAGTLKPGLNRIDIAAVQRHRTDCSVGSTFELWTEIDPSTLFLTFDNPDASRLRRVDDIRAIGVDGTGASRFRLVVPALERPGTAAAVLHLAEALALLSNMPNQAFDVTDRLPKDDVSGAVTVVAGTHAELTSLLDGTGIVPTSIPGLGVIADPTSGVAMLVVTGPTWPAILQVLNDFGAPAAGAATDARTTIGTDMWRPGATVLANGQTDIAFSQLGVPTQEFSGRRFRTEFTVGIPSDFYADAYGQARILLDAAYSPEVLPGSAINVFVNGEIASSLPITSAGGALLHQLPIKVTTRHLRPGVNLITLDATILTDEDAACAPGATASTTPRFAVFDTSTLSLPDFARIARVPNLAAMAGAAFPYDRETRPVPLFLDRIDNDRLSAAATLAGKLALAAGRILPLEVVSSADALGDRSALFLGTISQMPQSVLMQLGISETSRTVWTQGDVAPGVAADTDTSIDAWRERMGESGWYGELAALRHWVRGKFDLSLSSLRFAPSRDDAFLPPLEASVMIAQQASPQGSGTWTLVAAPTAGQLRIGVVGLTGRALWNQLDGHAAVYDPRKQVVRTEPVGTFRFVVTEPLSLSNLRLIAANWLSDNILSYALLLGAFGIVLGVATSALLRTLGRR